jgi:hypothetical protein
MLSRYLPIVLGVVAIVGLTIPQILMTDRHRGSNVSAEQRAKLLAKVPEQIGDWVGEDKEVSDVVRDTAGATGAVSREYRNVRTGEKVDLWLIVGHGRQVSAHTPDICYRGSGFEMRAAENSLYTMAFPDQEKYPFLTNTFVKEDVTGRRLLRVFWSWYNPESQEHEGKVVWEAPSNARWYFGNTRALYKMYFTSEMSDQTETADNSACLRFAREFMPIVNDALAEVYGDESADVAENTPGASSPDTSNAGTTAGEDAAKANDQADSSGLFGVEASDANPPSEAVAPEK